LLDDACVVMPALGEYELAECAAGLRPMSPDNLPLVGRLDERTLVAAGHGRSGFLLAPWTAEKIAAELGIWPESVEPGGAAADIGEVQVEAVQGEKVNSRR
jgi:glycine oxidase